jgi:hypothetical protein
MAKKVLTGTGYDFARFVGIKREVWTRVTGRETPTTDTQFAEGTVVTNAITQDVGLILDADSAYFSALHEPHLSRLVDVVEGDGWMDITPDEG